MADGTGVGARKPVRGGIKAAKQFVAKRTGNTASAAQTATETSESYQGNDSPRTTPHFNKDKIRAPAREVKTAPAEAALGNEEAPQALELCIAEKARTYPKRGIARSTGARALPPARAYGEQFTTRQETGRIHASPLSQSALPTLPLRCETSSPPQTAEAGALRRPLTEPPRLSRRISEMSLCSRREADQWIENGWVSVDGLVVTTLGSRVHPGARIEIKDAASAHQTESVTILLNKPLDLACEPLDGDNENALLLIRPENRWREDDSRYYFKATHLRGLALAGKLDADATGMLVFTQEASVSRRLTGDDTRLEKEYMVRVEGELAADGMKLLNQGLALDDVNLKRTQVSWQSEQQLRFVLHESRKRQIQRMCALVGLCVTAVKRIRIGSVSLGKLPVGQWRYLRDNERF